MVEYILKNRTANRLVYEYYPQGDTEKLPGVISVWIKKKDVVVDIVAEDDYETTMVEEINELKDSIDDLYKELDIIPEDDEDWVTVAENYTWYYYAEKVVQNLMDDILQGKIRQYGRIA